MSGGWPSREPPCPGPAGKSALPVGAGPRACPPGEPAIGDGFAGMLGPTGEIPTAQRWRSIQGRWLALQGHGCDSPHG